MEYSETESTRSDVAVNGLKQMGYKQELTRTRGCFHILSMLLAITAVPFGLAAPLATSLIGGGPVTMIWGWVVISITTQPLALSLAELCSKYPTAAGTPYWCFQLTSSLRRDHDSDNRRRRLLAAWINGWLTMVGVWTISLSVTFGTAQILIAGINMFKPGWVPTTWQTYLVFVIVTLFSMAIGVLFNKHLPIIDIACAIWTVVGVVVILICLSIKASSGRHTAAYAFTHFDASASGWTSVWAFFIGLLPPAYTYSAIGMVASMAEEVHNPGVQLPLALSWVVPIGFVIGIIFLLPVVFTLPDMATLLAVPGGQPIGVLFELIMGTKAGGFGLSLIVFGVGIFCGISINCAASRATWSFARDSAIPFSSFFSRVTSISGSQVPLNAYLLSVSIQLLLGLLYLGSDAAFNAFLGVAATCLGASYVMPIGILLCNRRSAVRGARFWLGDSTRFGDWFGWAMNVWAVIWMGLEIVVFSMPAVRPVSKTSMNYASAVFVGFGLISAVWYIISGRKNYKGPPNLAEQSKESEVNEAVVAKAEGQ